MGILVKIGISALFLYLAVVIAALLLLRLKYFLVEETYKKLEQDNEDFSHLGINREFVEYVWNETKKAYPEATGLKMPAVYFTSRNQTEFGFYGNSNLYGISRQSEAKIVVFPISHVILVSRIATGWWTDKADDFLACISVTLVHEFRHYILFTQKIVLGEHHRLMLEDKAMHATMFSVAWKFSPYAVEFVENELAILKESVHRESKK